MSNSKQHNKKYEIAKDKPHPNLPWLYRIRALRDFGHVKKGDIGGFVKSEANLSHEGNAWIADDAIVSNNAHVSGDALVHGKAIICESVVVTGNADIGGWANFGGNTEIGGETKITAPPPRLRGEPRKKRPDGPSRFF